MVTAVLTAWNFVRNIQPKGWLTIALLVVVLVAAGTCAVQGVRNHFDRNNAVKVNNADRDIREDLSVKRQDTETKITADQKELETELAKLPDAMPSDRRLVRACRELRNNRHVKLPAACGSIAGGGSSVQP